MPRGKKNESGVDWSDPAQVAAYKRESESHHAYNRRYIRDVVNPRLKAERRARQETPVRTRADLRVLSADDVLEIRRLRAEKPAKYTYKALSKLFGVAKSTIQAIIVRDTWKDI